MSGSCDDLLLGWLLATVAATATFLGCPGRALAADPLVPTGEHEAERARRLAEMKEILASFGEAVRAQESMAPSHWSTPARAETPPVDEPVKTGGETGDRDLREIAGLRLSSSEDEGRANLIPVDHVETLDGADGAGEASSSHAFAMRLGHLDDVRWRVAAMRRRPDPPRPPSQVEAMRRVVRDNFGLFEVCYEEGLRLDPTLGGRVVVKFEIGPTGQTEFAADGGLDLADPGVIDCVVRAFSTLGFAPPGARVVVVYPLVFRPEEPRAAGRGAFGQNT